MRIAACRALARRPVADDHARARQVERQQRLEILLDRDAADIKKDRPRQAEAARRRAAGTSVIDAARPDAHAREAAPRQFVADRGRRRHHRRRGRVEMAQQMVGPILGDQRARAHIFGKARVIAGGEQPPALQAIAPRRPADRPFGGDMDVVGAGGLDAPRRPRDSWRSPAGFPA